MEKLMTRNQFIEAMRVNKSTVSRWISNGRISINQDGLIDYNAALRSLSATESLQPHHQANIARIEQEKAQSQNQMLDETDQLEGKEEISMRYKRAMAKEREAKAELAAMERDQQAGILVERSEVDFVMRDIGITLRSALESMPDRIASTLAAHRGDVNAIHADLDDAIHTLLTEVSEHMRRSAERMAS